jgi:3D (Asp-Asp-Asp) domain-containing protein
VGLDRAIPGESDAIPQDARVGVARVHETVSLVQDPIPFGNQSQDADDVELGIEQVLQPGLPGLSVTRTRVRFQDNVEVSRLRESEVVVRPPQDRLVLLGTKIVDKTTTVDGVSLSYWYTMQMYATVYSPCNSGTADGSCSTGTASGLRAGKGVVAVDPGLFAVLNGQRLYIPGYGHAVIGDVGGGYIVEQNLGISRYKWIDLGFDDDNIQDMSGWITVYFLSPAPAAIPDVLK